MKKLILITSITIYVLFAISSFVAIASENKSSILQVTATEKISSDSVEDSYQFILTVENGKIVVKNNKNQIVNTTDTMVSILPKQDKEKLYRGIRVENERELNRLLEDFCS